jgi:hypothetical protein
LPNPTYPLPYTLDDSVRSHVRALADRELAGAPSIFIVGLARHEIIKWVRGLFEARGYSSSFALHEDHWVLELRKPAPGP